MPLYQLLTDRTLAQSSAITPTTLIHIVTTGDTSQNSAGSSYKAELGQLVGLFSGSSDTLVTGGTYSAGTITFTNSTGGTFTVTGLTTGDTTTITGATSVGTGLTIFNSIVDRDIKINTITGDTFEKITSTLSSNTIELGINEQNLDLWSLVVQGNRLINGGAAYVSGLTFETTILKYIIGGEIYNILSPTTLVLSSGDTTFDRIDVLVADISGNTSVVQGTPSANPEKPDIDEETQVEITFVSIPANGTIPDLGLFLLYNENLGPPTEWTFGAVGAQPTRISGSSTDQAYSGSTSIRVSGVTGVFTTSFRLTGSTVVDTNEYATLQFAIKNLSANTTTSQIRIGFRSSGGTQNGSYVFMNSAGSSGYVQYTSNNTSTWQLISIPLWRFYLTNTNTQVLEFSFNSSNARYYFDMIRLVDGLASSPPTNAWTTFKGDGATTITAPNPNATLTISGGTNIGSFISGSSTVVLNLDNNIVLNSVTATTLSATTYQNLPTDIRVTGATYSNNEFTYTNNTGGTYSVLFNTVTGLTVNGQLSVTGNTGLGTNSPITKLDISSSNNLNTANNTLRFTDTDTGASSNQFSGKIEFYSSDSSGVGVKSYIGGVVSTSSQGSIIFGTTGTTGSLTGGTTVGERMRINSDGYVGIGINEPQYFLHAFSGGSQFFYNPTSSGGVVVVSGSTNLPRYVANIPAYLTNLAASTSFGIRAWNDSTTPAYGKVGDAHVYSSVESNGINIISAPGSGTEDYIRFYAGKLATSTSDIYIQGSGATKGYVGLATEVPTEILDVNGNGRFRSIGSTASAGALHYTSDGTLTTNTSDIRLKENIEPLTNSLEKVLLLSGVTYNWIGETGKRIGMIAQNVEKVIPELVFTNNNTEERIKGIHQDNLTAVLVEAVKEQQKIIEELKIRISNLES